MSDLVGNADCWFYHAKTHISLSKPMLLVLIALPNVNPKHVFYEELTKNYLSVISKYYSYLVFWIWTRVASLFCCHGDSVIVGCELGHEKTCIQTFLPSPA